MLVGTPLTASPVALAAVGARSISESRHRFPAAAAGTSSHRSRKRLSLHRLKMRHRQAPLRLVRFFNLPLTGLERVEREHMLMVAGSFAASSAACFWLGMDLLGLLAATMAVVFVLNALVLFGR
ncbi:hypothetical protein ABPG75_004958 [Micractinium tetrahymenae]